MNDKKKFSEQNCDPPGRLEFTYCGPKSAMLIVELRVTVNIEAKVTIEIIVRRESIFIRIVVEGQWARNGVENSNRLSIEECPRYQLSPGSAKV